MRWFLPVLLLTATAALAHDADLVVVRLEPGPQPGQLGEVVTLTPATLAMLAPLDADGDQSLSQADLDARPKALSAGFWDEVPMFAGGMPCERLAEVATMKEGFVELQARLHCGEGELRQDFKILRVLPANYRVAFNAQPIGDEAGPRFAQGSLTTITVPRSAPPNQVEGAFQRGIRRGLSVEAWAALFAVLISIGAWKRGAIAVGLVLLSVVAASAFTIDSAISSVFLVVICVGVAIKAPPLVVPLLLGAAIGVRDGEGLIAGLGTGLVLLLVSPLALALGVALTGRPRLLRVLRWVPAVVALAAVLRSRLWW